MPGITALLTANDDAALHALMTNLAGHDLAAILEGFGAVDSVGGTATVGAAGRWLLPKK